MKKISRYILLIAVLILFVGLAPRFLRLQEIQDTITEQLSKKLDSQVTVQEMRWAWLPLPHLSFSNTKFSNDYSEFSVPVMKIYPNWRIILNQEVMLGSIHLEHPEIDINKKAFQAEKSSELTLPELNVYIKNGTLEIDSVDDYKDVLLADNHIFSNINGILKMEGQEAEFELHVSSSFSRSISLQGNYNINTNDYHFLLDFQNIKLHKSVNTLFDGLLVPVKSTARLAGSITGTGLQSIEGNLHGTLPSFAVRQKDREILLTPGFTDFAFLKSGPLFRLTIKDLEMKEPLVNLSGLIEKNSSANSNDPELQETPVEPFWILDLAGSDLDLTTIRHKILTLWPDNEVAQIVCGIVIEGKAASAAYRFSGRTSDFKDLNAMVIEADAIEAAVHVPGAELDLTNAKGPVLIEESILTGHNLSAQMGNSFGSKAELLLDLSDEGNAFSLNIDIDADLKALPPVLEQLVDHKGFLHELSKFKEVSGRAKGKLRLGDTLDNIITRVDVGNMKLSARYEPIPQTVFIDKGALHVGPKKVTWQKVKGRTGQQEVINTKGNVSWQTGDTLLHVEEMQGQLDGESFYTLLEQTGIMPEKIKANLSSLQGNIDVTQGMVKGPARKPEAWEYQLAVKTKGSTFTTPLLPEPVTIKELSAAIGDKDATIQQAEVNFLDQPLILKGTFHHQELENWYGTLELNGPLEAGVANWISSKGWFYEKMRPRIPCTMKNMNVSFQGNEIAIEGTLLPGLAGAKLPMAKIDLESTPERLRINELTFIAAGEQGTMTLDLQRLPPKKLTLSWQGFANAATIDALFHHSAFTGGTFSGVFFEASYFADQPEATRFTGLLKAENLLLKGSGDSETKPIIFKNALLNGTGNQLRISVFNLDIGTEKIIGSGYLAAEQKGLQLNIDLTSSFITKKSLNDLAQGLQESHDAMIGASLGKENELETPADWDITGRIGFNFDSFSMKRNTTTLYTGSQLVHYTLYDVQGEFQLAQDDLTRTEISSAKLCGLDFKSTWYSDDVLGQHIELATGSNTGLRLENVLPCLGVNQDIIEGDFSLKANLRKESGAWHSGNIYLKSTKGRILRLRLLSKIFKVVNITELFKTEAGSTGKKGFPFTQMDIDTHLQDNNLLFDRAILLGEGLNLFLQGDIHLDDYDADLTLLVAPFKSFDTLVSKVPIIGQPIMNEYDSLVAIPVAIKGPLSDPLVTPLHLKTVGGALFNIVTETLKLPYHILKPHE